MIAEYSRKWGRALAIWLLLMAVETVHGTVRTLWLAPWLGDLRARQVSVFSGSVLILGCTYVLSDWLAARHTGRLLLVGLLWVALTVAFEIALGRSLGYGWTRILAHYDVRRGGLMPVGLVAMLAAPWLAARVRGATFPPIGR